MKKSLVACSTTPDIDSAKTKKLSRNAGKNAAYRTVADYQNGREKLDRVEQAKAPSGAASDRGKDEDVMDAPSSPKFTMPDSAEKFTLQLHEATLGTTVDMITNRTNRDEDKADSTPMDEDSKKAVAQNGAHDLYNDHSCFYPSQSEQEGRKSTSIQSLSSKR